MNRIIINYSHDHENDTRIQYSYDAKESHLDAWFESEDPDCGTEHLEYNSRPVESLVKMATELREEIGEYLDRTDNGLKRNLCADDELEICFGGYNNATLYAIESALRIIEGGQTEAITDDGNLIQIMTVKEAARIIKDTYAERSNVWFDIGVSVGEDINYRKMDRYAKHLGDLGWFGVKRIPNDYTLFDGSGYATDHIFMVGHYGGGNIQMAYYVNDEYMSLKEQDESELVRAICDSADVKPHEKILMETIEE